MGVSRIIVIADSRLSTQLRRAPTRYVPTRRIASGGMAEVWEGLAYFETGATHRVALKRVLPELASQPLYRSMFEDETRLGMMLRHPAIVRVYDGRIIAKSFIMVMELVDGTSLKAILDRAHARRACMPVPTALWIARALAHALAYAHRAVDRDGNPLGIIHRDVSPHNLLLGRNGAVKLTDFGLANASVHQTSLGEGMLGGKLGYLAPEILQRNVEHSSQIDVFAAGIVLWEMLCGQRLFMRDSDRDTVHAVGRCEVPTPSSINRKIPAALDDLVLLTLAKDPAARIRSAAALAEELDDLIVRVDPRMTNKDVALVVGLHLATEPLAGPTSSHAPAAVFLAELDALVTEGPDDIGADPLDPDLFG